MSDIAVVIVSYNSAMSLGPTLDALGTQLGPDDELVVVDNASLDCSAALARAHPAVTTVVDSTANLGFSAGCNRGASATTCPLIVFLNPDAVPDEGCIAALRGGPGDWSAWMGVVALGDGRHVNSAGGELHFLGFAWAGRHGEPLGLLPTEPWECQFLSGACLAVRRDAWLELGGFCETYFMYHEDVDFSLRLRLDGRRFGVLPLARVRHDYSFIKGAEKWRLLERNRWLTILRTYPGRLLVILLPALLALEPVLLVVAGCGGWLPAKARSQVEVLGALPRVLRERRDIQARRRIGPRAFADGLGVDLDSSFFGAVTRAPAVRVGLRAFGWVTRCLLGRR